MSRLIAPGEPPDAIVVSRPSPAAADALAPAAVTVRALQQQLADLQREVVSLRTQRQRDMATTRGLGEALQALRRGALALRTENEELRRQLAGRGGRRR
jgi:TolA-binding protein